MTLVDRANYVPSVARRSAYQDAPQSIGYNATISAPHMHAFAAELLLPYLNHGCSVMDVGSGSGYLLATLHHLVPRTGCNTHIVGVEHIQELVRESIENLKRDGLGRELENGRIVAIQGDGRKGCSEFAPYSAIHVGAAAPCIPETLIQQLASPGRLIVPVECPTGNYQYVGTLYINIRDLYQIDKDVNGNVEKTILFGVMVCILMADSPVCSPDQCRGTMVHVAHTFL